MELKGTALVVGAGGGIGSEVVSTIALNGARTVFCADVNFDAAQKTCDVVHERASVAKRDVKLEAVHVDVTKEESVQDMMNRVEHRATRLDYFVNSSGFGNPGQTSLHETSLETDRSLDEAHNIGTFLCLRAAIKSMRKQELMAMPVVGRGTHSSPRHMSRGSIVILVSLASEGAFQGVAPYIAAKHACAGLVQNAAIENGSQGIRVNAVSPSIVSGPMINKFMEEAPETRKEMLADLPSGRLAEPEEVADCITFLCSTASSYINGHTMIVDGGCSVALSRRKY